MTMTDYYYSHCQIESGTITLIACVQEILKLYPDTYQKLVETQKQIENDMTALLVKYFKLCKHHGVQINILID